jgi:uncharacterized membrane protein
LGNSRNQTQDVLFPLTQLVQVAVQALSPGINDPFTAITVVDWLGDALCHAAGRYAPSPYAYDEAGALRVIDRPVTFAELAEHAFADTRRYARSDLAVIVRLLETIGRVGLCARRSEDLVVLREHADLILAASQEGLPDAADRAAVRAAYRAAVDALDNSGAAP